MMHKIVEWEASRSGAGITVAMTTAEGVRRKQLVKKIEAKGGCVVAIGGDGARFALEAGRETSAEVAAIAGELLNLEATEFSLLTKLTAGELVAKIRTLAASALGQHQ